MTDLQDVVVIGAGPGGFAAAMRAAQLGGTVTLIEQDAYGGNCMHRACIPTKGLTTVAQRMIAIREAKAVGIEVAPPKADMESIHERKGQLVQGLRLGTEQLLRGRGVTLVQGQGRLVSSNIVEVDSQQTESVRQIRTRTIILATGSVPAQPPIAGVDLPGVLSTEEAIELREIPPKLAILGSQPWDFELAQCFHTLGSQVTLITQERQLLSQTDREIAQRLAKVFHDAGITLCRGMQIDRISQTKEGRLAVTLSDDTIVVCDKLIAARRLPNAIGLGAHKLGIGTDAGAIQVNERLQTNLSHIYAVGDVAAVTTGDPIATAAAATTGSHKASAEGIVAAENAMGQESKLEYTSIPYGLHTWPEVAWVGITEERAEALGLDFKVGRAPLAINPQALILNQTAGLCKLVIGTYGKILGAHVIAPGAVDLINTIAVAMLSEATVHELIRLVPLHPSIGETLVDAAMDVEQRSLHLLE